MYEAMSRRRSAKKGEGNPTVSFRCASRPVTRFTKSWNISPVLRLEINVTT